MSLSNGEYLSGYRPKGERPKSWVPSFTYLQETREEVLARERLEEGVQEHGAPCVGSEEWVSDDLPTDREAQKMCAPCPVFDLCKAYAERAHPAWGVWGGKVYGRNLEKAMQETPKPKSAGDKFSEWVEQQKKEGNK